MTKPVNRPHKKSGRKKKTAPAVVSTATIIEAMAADGRTVVGIAKSLNTSNETLIRWMEDDPELAQAFARGKETERHELHNSLRRAARRGNINAATFLLTHRHGYRSTDGGDSANKVAITFTLPGAKSIEDYKVIEHETTTPNEPVSAKSLRRT